MTIKRYRMVRDPWNHAHMTARDDGEFVLHEDHLALVAAAYRDAAEASDCGCEKNKSDCMKKKGFVSYCYRDGAADVSRRTPADAEVHLTALLRAEYERGVREAAAKCTAVRVHADTTEEEAIGALICASDILGLLTQEGR